MTYYMYFIQTLVIRCTINELQPLESSVTLIWPLKVIQGQSHKVNWKIIYDFVYVLHTNIGHSMHRFWDIGPNRYQRSKLDLSDFENNLYNQSTPLKFENSTRITSEKTYEAIHLGSTSILLINIEKCENEPNRTFLPLTMRPLEWFNQILLFTVHHHHPGEASCQNREKVTEQILNKWTISVKIGEKWQI